MQNSSVAKCNLGEVQGFVKIYNREPNPLGRTRKILHEEVTFQDETRRTGTGQEKS